MMKPNEETLIDEHVVFNYIMLAYSLKIPSTKCKNMFASYIK